MRSRPLLMSPSMHMPPDTASCTILQGGPEGHEGWGQEIYLQAALSCLGHPGLKRAGGRCGTLVLTEGWRSPQRPGPQGTLPFSSFGWRLLQEMSIKKSFERCSRLGIKLSSPCGQASKHIEDILKPEKLILSTEQRSTLTSLRPSPRHAATMLLM